MIAIYVNALQSFSRECQGPACPLGWPCTLKLLGILFSHSNLSGFATYRSGSLTGTGRNQNNAD